MNLRRALFLTLLVATLQACATPPGSPLPKPTDYAELNHASDVFKRWSVTFGNDPDVNAVFLTSNNNPRRIVVHCKDHASHDRMLKQYGGTIEGIDVWYYIDDQTNPDDPIVAVPKVEPPHTFWEKVMAVFTSWRDRLPMGRAASPAPGATPAATPAGPLHQI